MKHTDLTVGAKVVKLKIAKLNELYNFPAG